VCCCVDASVVRYIGAKIKKFGILYLVTNTKYFRFLSRTNSALKITSAISVPNLVKIGEKLRPLSLTKEKNFVIPEVDRSACALIKSLLAINNTARAPFTWESTFKIW